MSDDRRKSARTQGRFANTKEFRPTRPNKDNKQSELRNGQKEKSSQKWDETKRSQTSKPRSSAEGIQYQENSNYVFKELTEKKKPEEIRERGVHKLSETENGISRIIYEPDFLPEAEAEDLMVLLRDSTKWCDRNIIIHGEEHRQPRLVAWYGPFQYSYSGVVLDEAEMPNSVTAIKNKVEACLKKHGLDVELNSVLLNFYRNEKDSVAWHSDDESTMGIRPTIASVSLGVVRVFQMRPKTHVKTVNPETELYVNLLPGSLIIMDGCMQKDWQHQVPKEKHDRGERINLTFRTVYPIDQISTKVPHSTLETENPLHSSSVTQPEPVYDAEHFPPLMLANTPISKISLQSKPTSTLHDSPKENATTISAAEQESLTDHNDSKNKSLNHPNRNGNPLQDDALLEAKSSSHSKLSPCNELVTMQETDEVREEPAGGFVAKPCRAGVLNSFHPSQQPSTESLEESGGLIGNEHQLNVNAPDFIPRKVPVYPPKFKFCDCSLTTLVDLYMKKGIGPEETEDLFYALIRKLNGVEYDVPMRSFTERDWLEMTVYTRLSKTPHQSVENQKVIMDRICCMVNNYLKCESHSRGARYNTQRNYGKNYYKSSPRY